MCQRQQTCGCCWPSPLRVPREAAQAGLVAGIVAALVIFVAAGGLLHLFPLWVADTSPANVPAAGRLANNVAGDEDAWFFILFLGSLVALTASLTASLAAGVNRRS